MTPTHVSTHQSTHLPTTPKTVVRREESYMHFLARESQLFLEIVIVVSLVMTVLLMVTFFFFAFIPVIVLLLSYGLLVLANAIERRTDAGRSQMQGGTQGAVARTVPVATVSRKRWVIDGEDALRRRLARVSIEVLVGAGLLAFVMASIVLPVELLILGVGVLFAYIVFISAPFWVAWLNDESSDEQRRQAGLNLRH